MNHNGLAGVRTLENSQSTPVLQCTAQSQRKRRTENLQIHDYRAENWIVNLRKQINTVLKTPI